MNKISIYPCIEDQFFYEKLWKKKEFCDLIDEENKNNYIYKFLSNRQEFVRRFLSPFTPYKRLILIHGTGSGKSYSAISVAEDHKEFYVSSKKTLVLVKGKPSADNFYKLIKSFYKLQYVNLEDNEIDKQIESGYDIKGYIKFTKDIIGRICI